MARMTGAVALALAGASFLCGNAQNEAVGPLVTYFLVLEGLYTQMLVKAPISVNDETVCGMRTRPRHNSRIQNSPLMMVLVRGKAM